MIQRIQSIYFAIVIILLSCVSFGMNIFDFLSDSIRYSFDSYGITHINLETNTQMGQQYFPVFIGFIALILLTFIALMSYKNLDRQYKLGRTIFYIYFLSVVSIVLVAVFGNSLIEEDAPTREMGLGFFLFIAGLPFSFLANTGVKRDRSLLKSLDRMR